MPAKSKSQQRLMGMAYAYKKGELKASDLDATYREEIVELANNMSLKDLEDFAKTSHKGLPEVKEAEDDVVEKMIQMLLTALYHHSKSPLDLMINQSQKDKIDILENYIRNNSQKIFGKESSKVLSDPDLLSEIVLGIATLPDSYFVAKESIKNVMSFDQFLFEKWTPEQSQKKHFAR